MNDTTGAFVPHGRARVAGTPGGVLAGLTFAAKDLFDVAGERTGAGNPTYLATHEPARCHAWAVERLLAAGADLVGKTVTDELAYGMTGRNAHYGTPVNGGAPDRLPGGSSSGSASVVSNGIVDFALGSDTGGSIRIPASYCGIYGLRPTHGRVPLDGVAPLSPSFDTVGWFARDAGLMARVGDVLLGSDGGDARPFRALIADDAFALTDPKVATAVQPLAERVARLIGRSGQVNISKSRLIDWVPTYILVSAREAWETDGPWISRHRPELGADVKGRFERASKLTEAEVAPAKARREEIAAHVNQLLGDDAVLVLPTAPTIAPRRDATLEELEAVRARNLALTAIAGLSRLPQINLPAARVNGAPVGLSLIGPAGSDHLLLRLAVELARS